MLNNCCTFALRYYFILKMSWFDRLIAKLTKRIPDGHEFYSGKYFSGHAEFLYIPKDGKKIMDGEFKFEQKLGGGMYRKASGIYENDKKSGTWYFARRGSNSMMQLMAEFTQGILNGVLEYSCEEATIGGSMRNDLRLTIASGKIEGDIEGFFVDTEVKGAGSELEDRTLARVNYILNEDVNRLLRIAPHGSENKELKIEK